MIPIPVAIGGRSPWGGVNARLGGTVTAVGGGLILAEAILFPFPPTYFALGFLLGAAIVALGIGARTATTRRATYGVAAIGAGIVSLFVVDGFFLGAIFALVGGCLLVAVGNAPAFRNPASRMFTPSALGPPCPTCGRPIPTWTSKCPYCGAPEP